jgi:nucleotide-binding universal stress UspA family protein
MLDIKTILLTTDFSETSKCAIEPARTLARKFGAKIILVHVGDLFVLPRPDYYTVDLEVVRKEANAQARQQLERFAAEHFGSEPHVELASPEGVPHLEIIRLAEERRADMIVMATHGRSFLWHVALGSTTERVLRNAPCPVLAVRDPQAKH